MQKVFEERSSLYMFLQNILLFGLVKSSYFEQ